jgi:hypothetical protein
MHKCNNYFCCGCLPRWFFCCKTEGPKDLGTPDPDEIRITNEGHTEDITDKVLAYARKKAGDSDSMKLTLRLTQGDTQILLPSSKKLPPRPSFCTRMAIRRRWMELAKSNAKFHEMTPRMCMKDKELSPIELEEMVVQEPGSGLLYEFGFFNGAAVDSDVHQGHDYDSVYVRARHSECWAPAHYPWHIEVPYLNGGACPAVNGKNIIFVVLKNYAPYPFSAWWFDPHQKDIEPFIKIDDTIVAGEGELRALWFDMRMGPQPNDIDELRFSLARYVVSSQNAYDRFVRIIDNDITMSHLKETPEKRRRKLLIPSSCHSKDTAPPSSPTLHVPVSQTKPDFAPGSARRLESATKTNLGSATRSSPAGQPSFTTRPGSIEGPGSAQNPIYVSSDYSSDSDDPEPLTLSQRQTMAAPTLFRPCPTEGFDASGCAKKKPRKTSSGREQVSCQHGMN